MIHLDPWVEPCGGRAGHRPRPSHRARPIACVRLPELVVEGSIEERMLELQERKAALAHGVLGHDAGGAR